MRLSFNLDNSSLTFDTVNGIDISIPLRFGGEQPNAFYLPRAEGVVAEGGDFVGDTRRGGSCNCVTVTLNPHGNGTHTECVGHLSTNRIAVSQTLREAFIPALLVSVEPVEDGNGGLCVAPEGLERAVDNAKFKMQSSNFGGLIIRTIPNDEAKRHAEWSGHNPPYLSADAARFVRSLGTRHLLVDLPSLDREEDPDLTAHRIFWNLPESGPVEADPDDGRTITEMIYVPDDVPDGLYLLNLQVPPFLLDAAPSRPILYRAMSVEP